MYIIECASSYYNRNYKNTMLSYEIINENIESHNLYEKKQNY